MGDADRREGPACARGRGATVTSPPTANGAAVRPERRELGRRSDGARYRRVTLAIDREGSMTLKTHDMGAGPCDAWGLDDEEVTLSIHSDQVSRLALALACEFLKDGKRAVKRLTRICQAYDVDCRIACWT